MVWEWSRCRPTTPANSTCEHNITQSIIVAMVTLSTYLPVNVFFILFQLVVHQLHWPSWTASVACWTTANSWGQWRKGGKFFPFLYSSFSLSFIPFTPLFFISLPLKLQSVTSWWCNVVYPHTPGAHHWSHPAASVYENLQLELCQDSQQVSHVWWYDTRR